MDLLQVMRDRHSVRSYTSKPIEGEVKEKLSAMIAKCNAESGLHIQLVCDEPNAFESMMAHYGKFSGVKNYIVMAGKKTGALDETCGYYGEKIVLYAQVLGLNTCWVAMTYSKDKAVFQLDPGEKVCLVIAVGYGETMGTVHKIKSRESVMKVKGTPPEWFLRGVDAARSKTAFELSYYDIIKDHIDRDNLLLTEISVELSSRPEDFRDYGLYYKVQGTIDLPVSIGPGQYETVMKEHGEAHIVTDELTGETALMKNTDNIDMGQCRLYFEGEDEPYYYMINYEPYSGTYELSYKSGDTLFKRVYEGDITVIKGAEQEYVNYFPLPVSGRGKGASDSFTDISPDNELDGRPFVGNLPAFDCNGYLMGLYYAGD